MLHRIILVIMMSPFTSFAQSESQEEIVKEGTKLYRSEMASWYGTDVFLEKFKGKQENIGGYLSYEDGNDAICIFFSNASKPRVLGTITFDSTYSTETVKFDGQERDLSEKEYDLYTIRQITLSEMQIDTLFKWFDDMNPNVVPLNDEKGKRVYILTGPKKQGLVVFRNDYLLTFNSNNELLTKKRLHKNLIPIDYGKKGGKQVVGTMHSHSPETGNLITATDICTLKLYGILAKWEQHYVISKENVSIWDCKKETLVVMPREAFIKAGKEKSNKK